jgi:hypothetical protein
VQNLCASEICSKSKNYDKEQIWLLLARHEEAKEEKYENFVS